MFVFSHFLLEDFVVSIRDIRSCSRKQNGTVFMAHGVRHFIEFSTQ